MQEQTCQDSALEMADEQTVERYSVEPWDIRRADMKRDPAGDYVRYDDHCAAIAAMPDTKALEAADRLADAYAALCEMTGSNYHTHEGSCYQGYRAARSNNP